MIIKRCHPGAHAKQSPGQLATFLREPARQTTRCRLHASPFLTIHREGDTIWNIWTDNEVLEGWTGRRNIRWLPAWWTDAVWEVWCMEAHQKRAWWQLRGKHRFPPRPLLGIGPAMDVWPMMMIPQYICWQPPWRGGWIAGWDGGACLIRAAGQIKQSG